MTLRTAGKAAANALAPLLARPSAQSLLDECIRFLEWLQGVGAGAEFSARATHSLFALIANIPGPVIFDVGANRGTFLKAALAEKHSAEFQLHAFEPGRAAYTELSAWAGSLPNVTLNHMALSSTAGSGVLFFDVPGSELSSLTPRSTVALAQAESVQLDTLDNYCRTRHIETIHLLKLDVEGHELEVLRGGEELFRRSAVRAVIFEFGGCNVDARVFFLDLYNFFAGFGMRLSRVTPSDYLRELSRYNESLERFRVTNFVATY